MRSKLAAAVLALCAAGLITAGSHAGTSQTGVEAGQARRPTARSFGGIRSWSEYVTMRDGVRLAVDVHVPKGLAAEEHTATILHMSRYYRSISVRGPLRLFLGFGIYPITERDIRERIVKAGYSWVDVDVRGAGASFGHRDYPLSAEEVRDGADLVEWILRQPWSAGVIGATGASYDGAAATLLLRNGHPAVKAIVPRFSGWDVYEDLFLPGGLQAKGLLHDWAKLTSAFDEARLTDVFGWTSSVVSGGVRPVDRRLLGQAFEDHKANVDLVALLGGVVYRDDTDPRGRHVTMDHFSPHTLEASAARVPIYAYGGWFDGALPRGQIRQYLSNGHPGSRLLMGPWFHAGQFNASPYASGRNDKFDHAGEMIRFFDYHLRGIDRGFTADSPVRYYTMGDERWRSADVWPPPGAVSKTLYLAPDDRLVNDQQPGTSSEQRSGSNGQRATSDETHGVDIYQVDEQVTSGSGSRWGLIVGTGNKRGYDDRREVDRRLLAYTSRPLERDLEVTGHPLVRLFLSANATDGAVFVYLEDVQPNGEVRYVTEGQLRLIHRQLGTSPIERDPTPFRSYRRADGRPLVPGEVTEAVFDLLPTSFLFRAGHSVRISIAGADAGIFDAPLPVSPLIYEVHRDGRHPSRIELPAYLSN
ncbi:MAG: CocE/NonD family hydrolase [Gemmatimonadetes bacterium]|nr:CocE/NonD family hydrolase [Gemmatimonadota bacterium]